METIQLTLYDFTELNEVGKTKALKEFAYINVEHDWYTFTIDDFKQLCETIGIEVDRKRVYFRGFYSQGDGSTFEARAEMPKLIKAINNESWKEYAPLLEFDFPPVDFEKRLIPLIESEGLDINPKIVGSERWYSVDVDLNAHLSYNRHNYSRLEIQIGKLEKWLQKVAEVLNRYLYKSLEKEYEYQTSENAIIETIEANEYQFTADGKPATRIKNLAKL